MATWQVHRFRDCVAIYSGSGPTVYLPAGQAETLAKGVRACAQSIRRERFANSPALTVSGECIEPEAENRGLPTMERRADGRGRRYQTED